MDLSHLKLWQVNGVCYLVRERDLVLLVNIRGNVSFARTNGA